MASNSRNSGSQQQQQNPFQQDGAISMNSSSTAHPNTHLYQQLCALAGVLNTTTPSANGCAATSTSSTRPQENGAIALNPAILNQLHTMSASYDASAARTVQSPDPSSEANAFSASSSSLHLNPQFISLLSAALQKTEAPLAMQQQRQTPIPFSSSGISNPSFPQQQQQHSSFLPLHLDPQQKPTGPVAFQASLGGVGIDEPPQVLQRNEECIDPNVLKLQKLLLNAAATTASTAGPSHPPTATATSLPNQVAIMQFLVNAIQQQQQQQQTQAQQIHRVNTTPANTNNIPVSVTFPKPSSPSFNHTSQTFQSPMMASSSTVKKGVLALASDHQGVGGAKQQQQQQQGPWPSSTLMTGGDSSQDRIHGSSGTVQKTIHQPPTATVAASFSPFLTTPTNSRPLPKKTLGLGMDGMVVGGPSAVVGIPLHSTKTGVLAPCLTNVGVSQMQSWNLNQLEKHVTALSESNQPIPQVVSHLLSEARRKEEKRNAKRVANRKSACTSRARKKALVEEMTRTNERLKRQALILSLLPDLVISITVEGEITFCSDQVERVLRHRVNDLCGANLDDIVVPASRDALHRLIKNLADAAEQAEASSGGGEGGGCSDPGASAGGGGMGRSEGAAVISQASCGSFVSFPLSEVNVKNYNRQLQLEHRNRIGDSSDSHHKVSTATSSNSASRSGTLSSFGNQSNGYSSPHNAPSSNGDRKTSDDESDSKPCSSGNGCDKMSTAPESSDNAGRMGTDQPDALSNRGDDSCSSLSGDNGKEQQKLFNTIECTEQKNIDSCAQNVTAKNFEGRSSSASSELSVDEKQNKNGSEDSGYRESTESEHSESVASNSNEMALKSRPLAPTCNICLIRDDLSTIWCEVTSSIHTTTLSDDNERSICPSSHKDKKESVNSNDQEFEAQVTPRKELLLCLRPIRDGTEKVSEELKFRPPMKPTVEHVDFYPLNDDDSESMDYPNDARDSSKASSRGKASSAHGNSSNKRKNSGMDSGTATSRKKPTTNCVSNDTEKTVAESLMLMSYFQ